MNVWKKLKSSIPDQLRVIDLHLHLHLVLKSDFPSILSYKEKIPQRTFFLVKFEEYRSAVRQVIFFADVLRVPFCKNQTNFKFRGKGRKFDFAHILMVDSLVYDKNYWIVFLAKYPFISKKYANYQSPLKSSFDAPFY